MFAVHFLIHVHINSFILLLVVGISIFYFARIHLFFLFARHFLFRSNIKYTVYSNNEIGKIARFWKNADKKLMPENCCSKRLHIQNVHFDC